MKRAVLLAFVVALSVVAAGSGAVGKECSGLPTCIDVPGPWVAVGARDEQKFLLDCPQRQGLVAGIDARADSRDLHVTWDALLGSPVSPGRATTIYTMFRGISGRQRSGYFQPLLGCVPRSSGARATTSAYAITPVGPPLNLQAVNIPLHPGRIGHTTLGCANKQHLVYGWHAIAFATQAPPPVELASGIVATQVVRGGQVTVTVKTSEALPAQSKPMVQIGVACAT